MASRPQLRKNSRLGSLGKPVDPTDDELRKEREKSGVPWSKSPFPKDVRSLRDDIGTSQNTVKVEVSEEVEWIDLLLELAMTTAFANLAENTPLLSGKEASSYIAFFGLVWWIWASQVAYNMRFRQADWFHRTCAFLQLVVLCGMSAFTSDFNIAVGLFNDRLTDEQRALQRQALNITESQQGATEGRLDKLPWLNSRGIAAVMGCSRLLMLMQYLLVLWYARHIKRRSTVLLHVTSLAISALLFFLSFILLGYTTKIISILKIVLWFSAIVLEVTVHFFTNKMKGHVGYRSEAVYGRSSTLFVVVLGVGLDKITNQFQFVVGASGFNQGSVGNMLSIAIILIGLFALYFGSGKRMEVGDNRKLSYFFGHFPFMTAVTILLRGVSTLLGFANLANALMATVNEYDKVYLAEIGHPEQCDIDKLSKGLSRTRALFWQSGLSFQDWIEKWSREICVPYANSASLNETEIAKVEAEVYVSLLQWMFEPVAFLFEQFKAMPRENTALYAAIQSFRTSQDVNMTNLVSLFDVLSKLLIYRLTPSMWFMAAGGGAVIMMGVLTLLRQFPRDRWEWGTVITRLLGGTVYAMLSLFNLKSNQPLGNLDPDALTVEWHQAIIWRFAKSDWILPSYAILLIVLNLTGFTLTWLARRSYRRLGVGRRREVEVPELALTPQVTQTPITASSTVTFAPGTLSPTPSSPPPPQTPPLRQDSEPSSGMSQVSEA